VSDYARAAALVLAALDLPPAQRAGWLDRECGGDDTLRADVASLLDAHDRADRFLETPPETGDPDDARLDEGAEVGPYRIVSLLGEGGMGVVYLAEDTRLGRAVALKAITPRFTGDERWRERLRREARAAAALTHPGIATVYALDTIEDRLFLATEHVAGENLRERLSRGPLAEADVRDIGRQLARTLAAAHDRGVVHCDIKPENVMWTAGGTVKILDFGLAHLMATTVQDAGPQLTQEGALFGTPAYMSPEQLRGEPAGPATDIFAVGVMLAELASGTHPFSGASPAISVARALSAEPDLAGVPASLLPVIRGCLAKSANDRFHSAHELGAALDQPERARTPRDHHQRAFRWWQFHQGAVSAFSVALAAGLWFARDWLPSTPGSPLLLAVLVGALAATTLRLHLWFTARVYPSSAVLQHRRVIRWIRAADLLQSAGVFAAGVLLPSAHPVATALLVASAVVLALLSLVVEPATARAAQLG
jgi:serine/threonine-protein kinase